MLLPASTIIPVPGSITKKKTEYKKKNSRPVQDLNLRGHSPIDFKSIALTTRPTGQDVNALSFENICALLPNIVIFYYI